jgi:anti-sigma B factor antagonist
MDFAIDSQYCDPAGIRLAVVGEVDVATAPDLLSAVVAAVGAADRVVLDLGRLTFIDAAGLGALVACRRYACDQGATLHLSDVPEHARRLLVITGLEATLLAPLPDTRPGADQERGRRP